MPPKKLGKEFEKLLDPHYRLTNLYRIRTKMAGHEGKTVVFKPNRVQRKIYQAIEDWNRIIILKPRKLGTTTATCLYLLDKAMYSQNQLCRTIAHRKQTVSELFNDIVRFAFDRIPEVLRPEEKYTTRAELQFKKTGSKYSIDVEARGMTPTFLHFSEIAYVDDEGKLEDTLESLPRTATGIAESTANGKGNWFERTFTENWMALQQGHKPEWYPLFFAWFDDPNNSQPWTEGTEFFYPKEVEEQAAAYKNHDGTPLSKHQLLWWDRKKFQLQERLPELYPSNPEEAFIFSTGRVFPEFLEGLHVISDRDYDDFFVAMDYGQTNPTVFLKIHQDADGNFIVFDEFYRDNCPIKESANWAKKHGIKRVHYPDPSMFFKTQVNVNIKPGASQEHRYAIADEFRRHGLTLLRGTQNDIPAGIVRVKEYLKYDPERLHPFERDAFGQPRKGSPRLFVCERCEKTIAEFYLYRWPKDPTGQLNKAKYEIPVKENDHCLSVKSMVLLSNGKYKRLSDLLGTCGLVLVEGDTYKFNHVRITEKNQNIYQLLLSNGSEILCTAEHLILDKNNEWKAALDYKVGEWIKLDTNVCHSYKQYHSRVPWREVLSLWQILPKKWKKIACSRLGKQKWEMSKRNACPSQRPKSTQQSVGKLGSNKCTGASMSTREAIDRRRKEMAGKECCKKSNASSQGMAQIRRGKELAFQAFQRNMEKHEILQEAMYCLWQAIRNTLSFPIKILSPQLQSESIKKKAKIISIEWKEKGDVCNMEVNDCERFVLSGGAIVHNSMDCVRYCLLSRGKPLGAEEDEAKPRTPRWFLLQRKKAQQEKALQSY